MRGASIIARDSTQCPCLRPDLSTMPVLFDTPGIRFRDVWTGRSGWRGQIFHMMHIQGAAYVIRNVVKNRRKSFEIPPDTHAQRPTRVRDPGFQERPYQFSKTPGCQLSRGGVRFSTQHLTETRLMASGISSLALKYLQILRVYPGFHRNISPIICGLPRSNRSPE